MATPLNEAILLEVTDLNVFYEDAQALWDINFIVSKEEIFSIIGANGAGESTILKTIAGLIRSFSGQEEFPRWIKKKVTRETCIE